MTSKGMGVYISSIVGIICLLLLSGCRTNISQDATGNGTNSQYADATGDTVDTTWQADCSVGLAFTDSIRFDTPPELPIGYLTMVRKDAVGNFVVGGLGQHVLVFDSLGSYLWSAGRFGGGPGEYSSNYVMDVDARGSLYVIDVLKQRIHEFANSKEHVRTSSLPQLSSMRNVAAGGPDEIVIINKDYSLRQEHPYAALRYSMTEGVIGTWGQMADIVLLQSYLDGGGVAIDVVRNAVYYGYMGDHRVFKTTLDGTTVRVFDEKPAYFIEADADRLVEFVDTVDRSELARTINSYAVRVSWVTALVTTSQGLVYQQVVKRLARGDDPLEMYLEVWSAEGVKLASEVATPHELLYGDNTGVYFMIDIEEATEKYGVAKYAVNITCPS